jgi:hypothetical protein
MSRVVRKRITSRELTEVRTVLSRARTALTAIDSDARNRRDGNDFQREYFATPHGSHELSMMRSALTTSIGVLADVEERYGYSEGT